MNNVCSAHEWVVDSFSLQGRPVYRCWHCGEFYQEHSIAVSNSTHLWPELK